MSDVFQLNLGPLRSAMSLTLHTHHAARVWHGRPAREGKSGIIGLSGFVALMNKIKRMAEQDDPYADYWMIQIQEKLESSKSELEVIRTRLDQSMSGLPIALFVGENVNVHPVTLPVFINSPFGFLAVYLLIAYDDIVRRLLLAHHTALMGRRDMEIWINAGGKVLRSLFGLAQRYKVSGVTRDDFITNNALARQAREKFGELPPDVLEGIRRSEYAPPILLRRLRDEADSVRIDDDVIDVVPAGEGVLPGSFGGERYGSF
ncbi:TIGR03761 family integrating conjugative element protein [Pseudomonas sp. NS1(2017)]|uniref:PFL_4669 family integrating conjugative element protein n=1 Tax=Pseudomonas sp. NS1(2017) TaxID=2025658 RepID=UPI000BA25817|nr:TIGR03761 family integrating conjugative element protein [Pseudomonas sp. NS1(2017)]ASV39801.1 TIGR03761 family integrating conjugative element protein [Pseudomonas sp. NS1(2017)]